MTTLGAVTPLQAAADDQGEEDDHDDCDEIGARGLDRQSNARSNAKQ